MDRYVCKIRLTATKYVYFVYSVLLPSSAAFSLLQEGRSRSPPSPGVFLRCGNAALDKHPVRLDAASCSG